MIEILPISGLPIFKKSDDIGQIIVEHFGQSLRDGDVLIVTSKIVSKAEGLEIDSATISPSPFATFIAERGQKDPKQVELILQESKTIVRMSDTLLIAETHHGFICANAGVDRSNARPGHLLLLPRSPDASAAAIRSRILELTGLCNIAVIISDTFGRPFRVGTTNVAIGVAGMDPLEDYRGRPDIYGYVLQHTVVARADELASAAGLVLGQAAERVPVAVIRGFSVTPTEDPVSARDLIRKREEALFW